MRWASAWAMSAAVLVTVGGLVAGCAEPPTVTEFVPQRAPLWTVDRSDPGPAVVIGGSVVADVGAAVAVFDRSSGDLRWRQPAGHRTVLRVGDAAIVEYGEGVPREPDQVRVIDLTTGKPSAWQDTDIFLTTRDTVVTRRCGYSTGRFTCLMTAVDLATQAVLWQTTKYWSTIVGGHQWAARPGARYGDRVVEPMRPSDSRTLVLHDNRTVHVVDIRTGRGLATWALSSSHPLARNPFDHAAIVGNTLVAVSELAHEPDDCRTRLAAYDLMTGRLRWQREAAAWLYDDEDGRDTVKVECDVVFLPGLVGATLVTATLDRRPQVIDIATGAVRRYGERGMAPVGLEAGTLVAQDFGRTRDVVAFDTDTGRERWRIQPFAPHSPAVEGIAPIIPHVTARAVTGGRIVYTRHDSAFPGMFRLYVSDLRTGKLVWATDDVRLAGVGPGWLASGDRRHLGLFPL